MKGLKFAKKLTNPLVKSTTAVVLAFLLVSSIAYGIFGTTSKVLAQSTWWQPTAAAPIHWQWQIGTDFNTATDEIPGVTVYDIDMFNTSSATVAALHAKGDIVIAYIDFGTAENWRPDYNQFPASVLGDNNGWPGEQWLNIADTSVLEPIMEARIELAKSEGFDAVEPDNIDGCENTTGFPLTLNEQLAYDEWIASAVHAAGMSVGLKNFVDEATILEPYFDWDLDEQAYQYQEWSPGLTDFVANNKAVFECEYETTDPQAATMNAAHINSMTRDLNLVSPSTSGYVRIPCIPDTQNAWTTSGSGTGTAAKLAFTTQPGASDTAGTIFSTQPVVTVEDANGNPVTTSGGSITLAITSGTGTSGAALWGTAAVNAVNGVATFSGLNISLAGTGYTLTATSSGLATAKSNAFNVVAGALDHITVSPSNPSVAVSGTQTYTAQGYDSLNNTISGLTYTWSCTNATAGTINSGGVFTSGTAAGSYGNVIQAVSGGKTGTASATVTGAVAAKLAFTTQPGASDTAGTIFSTQPVVTVEDANGSPVTTSGGSITLAITSGTGTSGAALCGAATVNAVNGVATFSGLNISLAGTGYTLTATSSGLTTATSSAFSIAAGALDHITDSPADPWVAVSGTQTYTAQGYDSLNNPISGLTYSWSCTNATAGTINSGGVFTAGTAAGSYGNVIQAVSGGKTGTASVTVTGTVAVKLAFTTQPGASDTAGTVFGTQPVVTVEDANGNPVTANGASISLVITSGTGTNGAALSGSTTENAVNGVATFSGLNVNLAGKGYTLTATSSDMTTATSSAFSIINATVYEGGTSFGGGGSSAAGGNSGEGIVSGGGNSISSSSGSGTTVTTTGVSSSGNEAGVTSIASSIASDGTILSRTEVGSSDGQVSLVIPQGTSFLGPDNSPCTSVSMMPMPVSQQPPAPAGAEIIGLVYNLGPTGSTFEPAASLTFTFNAAQLAGNVNENNMTVAYWDQTSGQWVPLNTEKIDLADGTITAAINHFSTYAILGYQPSPAEFVVSSLTINPSTVNPGEPVNVTVNVANTGEGAGTDSVILNVNGVEWGEQEVALDAGASQNVGFVVTENAATTYDLDINGLVGSFGMTPVTTLIATTAQTTAPVAAVLPLVSTASDSTTATLTNAPSNTPTPVLALTPVQVKKVRLVLLSEILGIALFLILIVTIIILVKRRDLLKKQ